MELEITITYMVRAGEKSVTRKASAVSRDPNMMREEFVEGLWQAVYKAHPETEGFNEGEKPE